MGKKKTRRSGAVGGATWVGGRVVAPFWITEGEPYQPEMILWIEMPDEIVVGCILVDRDKPPVTFGQSLRQTMERPIAGPSRKPRRVRVADRRQATELGKMVDIEVDVAPTPEIDRVVRAMAESMPERDGEEPSYFEAGRIPMEAVASLFDAAKLLFGIAPWKSAGDAQVLRMDIPAMGVEGACVSIIGALGESLGVLVFPSLMAFERFAEASRSGAISVDSIELGTTILSLNFERGADLPPSMLREAVEHGWPVAGPDAYPWVQHRDRDGTLRPLHEREVRMLTACARSLTAFFVKHGDLFGRESFEPVCESFCDENDLEVRFTLPYQAGGLFEVNHPAPDEPGANEFLAAGPVEPIRRQAKVGRNDPCPCGSGKKYKKCCLEKDRAGAPLPAVPPPVHEIDERLVGRIMQYAARRFGRAFFRASEDFCDYEETLDLFGPWAVYHFQVEGKPAVQWFVEERDHHLSGEERAWLASQRAAWLSVWEVQDVEPGRSMELLDLLTGEERRVIEVRGSATLARRDVILGRIVDHRGLSVLCGVHQRPLPPTEAAEVVRRIRGRLRRKRAVPVERLRDEKIGRYMISRWEEAVEDLDLRRSVPPGIQNTDGDELLLVVDHFSFDGADRAEIENRLAAIEGVEGPGPEDKDRVYSFIRPGNPMNPEWDNTLIGRAEVLERKLQLSTNSLERADALRQRVEEALGGLIRHRAREQSDPIAMMQDGTMTGGAGEEAPGIQPEEANELILQYKEKHYAGWPDHPLPALDGQTPRETVRTKAGRERVDVLLKDCENHEARLPEGQRYDFGRLRRELGLEK